MLVPSTRLLWITALVLVPLFTVLGMLHVPGALLIGLALVVGLLVALDAPSALSRLSAVSINLPEVIRVSKGRAFDIECTLLTAAGWTSHSRDRSAVSACLELCRARAEGDDPSRSEAL
jgi:hypothetical protein